MRAGRLREPVEFYRLENGEDRFGNSVDAWAASPFHTDWGDVLETLGRERVAAGRIEAPKTATLRVRSSSETRAVTEADKVFMRGLDWNIRSIIEVGRKGDQLEMTCEAGGAI